MIHFVQNSAAAIASLLIVVMTFGPLISIPPSHAATIITLPILA